MRATDGKGWYERIVALRRRGRIISRAPAQPQIARSRPQVPGCGPTRPRRQGRAWWGAPASTRLVTLARRGPAGPEGCGGAAGPGGHGGVGRTELVPSL